MTKKRLADIPIELQSHILSHLHTPPRFSSSTPVACTVSSTEWIEDAFSDDMLQAAEASTALSEAVIYKLGSQAKFLNFHRSPRLSEWISLLSKHVKAFSFRGVTDLDCCEEGCEEFCECDNLHKGVLKTLKALYENHVSLTALNLDELEYTDPLRSAEIAEHLIKAIQGSSSSLREISVQVNEPSAIAIPSVTLPNLQMAQISVSNYALNTDLEDFVRPIHAICLGAILRGLNGHANCFTNTCAVRELRLFNIYDSPLVDHQSCSALFSAVQKLLLVGRPNSKHSEIAKFIANFQNLETLLWITEVVGLEDMNKIFDGCPRLCNLELFVVDRYILPGDIPVAQNSPRLKDLFNSFLGRLKKFHIQASLSISMINSLGVKNSSLRALEMQIDNSNVRALNLLLGTHCRKLVKLRLTYSAEAVDCLGSQGWSALSRAICSASDKLCEFSLEGDRTGPLLERATYEMVESIVDILEFMGDRASSIEFRVPINTRNPFTVMDAISRTLNVAKTQCRSIQTLCLDYIPDFFLRGYRLYYEREDRLMDSFGLILSLEEDFNSTSGIEVDLGNIKALLEILE